MCPGVAVRDPLVLRLAEKVEMAADPEIKETAEGDRPCEVTIRLKDGRIFSHRLDYAKGSPQFPMTSEELSEKFLECAGRALDRESATLALKLIDHLEDLDNVEALCRILIGLS